MGPSEEVEPERVGSRSGSPADEEDLRIRLLNRARASVGWVGVDELDSDTGESTDGPSVAEVAANAGLDRETYLAAHKAASESLVNDTFQSLIAGAIDADTARSRLVAGIDTLEDDLRQGLGAFGTDTGTGDGRYPGVAAVLEALPMPAFLLDDEHTVLSYNEAVAALLGIGQDEALGEDNRETIAAASYTDERREMSLADKVVDAPRTADEAFDVDLVRGQRWVDSDYVYQDSSTLLNRRGEEIEVAFTAIPIFDEANDLLAVLELVEERSSGLEAFPGLAGILSHDIRNPLTILQGSLDTVENDIDEERYEIMQRSLDRIEELISGTLNLARRASEETDAQRLALEPLAVRAWSTVEAPAATLETENLTIEADTKQLRQALENLFRNAIEHGGDDVTIRVGPTDGGFFVEDTGKGIPPDERDRIFEHGYSSDRDGTGFGLPIVHKIAQNHGWSIDLQEGEEGGARFEFT